jgi:transcriptional regulator with XRE-family HTH domain
MDGDNIFAIRLKETREKAGLLQKDFAEKIGVSAATISAYEKGTKAPNINTVKKIASTFKVSIDWLTGNDSFSKDRSNTSIAELLNAILILCESLCGDLSVDHISNEYCAQILLRYDEAHPDRMNRYIISFISEWSKIFELFLARTIDQEMYDIWLEKKLDEYVKAFAIKNDEILKIDEFTPLPF